MPISRPTTDLKKGVQAALAGKVKKTPMLRFDEQALLKSCQEVATHTFRSLELDTRAAVLDG